MTMPRDLRASHYVVLGAIGGPDGAVWRPGRVLPRPALPPDDAPLTRLLDLGAIRPASAEEAAQEQVTLAEPQKADAGLEFLAAQVALLATVHAFRPFHT
jgi:hypothetical protein